MTTTDAIARALQAARAHGLSFKQLADELSVPPMQRGALRELLHDHLEAGRATWDGSRYRAATPGKKRDQGAEPEQHRTPARGSKSEHRAPARGSAQEHRAPARVLAPEPRGGQEREEPGGKARRARHGQIVQERQRGKRPGPESVAVGPAALVEGARGRRAQHAARDSHGGAPRDERGGEGEVVGILHMKPEGYGFVSPISGGTRADDLFLPPPDCAQVLDGDVVRVKALRGRDGRRAAKLIEVVEYRRKLCIGTYHSRGKGGFVEPRDRGFNTPVVVPRAKAQEGDLVKVRLERGPVRGDDSGERGRDRGQGRRDHGRGGRGHDEQPGAIPMQGLRGEVVEVLGPPGDPRFEMLGALYANGFNDEFDAAVEADARHVPDHVRAADLEGRRDLRTLPLVTIDGEDARDFDDAVHVSRAGSGYRLVVAIADVAHYVRPDSALDHEGLSRATSVYFPGRAVPMLPERLSNGICSLNPAVDRLCMVADMALDATGKPIQADLYEAVMKSHARLTYTQVAAALDGKPDETTRPLQADLEIAFELSKKLTARRADRGAIDFDLPEAKIVLNDDGTVKEIARRERNSAHRLIEECMLAANEAVARFFDARQLPTVYRIHDQPDPEKLAAFAALANTSGFELDTEKLTPGVLNKFLAELSGKPQQKALQSLMLRAMMQAQYSPDNIGHYGLAAPTYLHFTSPIRRYPDLMVHRLLKEHWARAGVPLSGHKRDAEEERLAGVSAQCSERERAAMKAERDVDAFYAALFMVDHVGERLGAVVSGLGEPGLFCELIDYAVEGLVHAETLGDGAEFDQDHHRIVVRGTGQSFSVGEELVVDVLASDPVKRRIELGFVSKAGEAGRGEKGKGEPAKAATPRGAATGATATQGHRPKAAREQRQEPERRERERPGKGRRGPRGKA